MCRVAYNIYDAADAVGVSPRVIVVAIEKRRLAAHRVDGKAIILARDLEAWIASRPSYLESAR